MRGNEGTSAWPCPGFLGGKTRREHGFHDLRRAFERPQLMPHKSLTTPQGYVNRAGQLNRAVGNLFVPKLDRKPPESPAR
jgi:hypothetical protein